MLHSAQPPEATLTPSDGERSERRPPARTPGAVPRRVQSRCCGHGDVALLDAALAAVFVAIRPPGRGKPPLPHCGTRVSHSSDDEVPADFHGVIPYLGAQHSARVRRSR
jgi:hypothetical protein